MRPDREWLLDILGAIDRILAKTAAGPEAFQSGEMLQVWVLHHLEVIGEAARGLSPEFRQHNPDKVWPKAVGLRNILVHQYFAVNLAEVWRVVANDLPSLRAKVQELLASSASPSPPPSPTSSTS